MDVPRFNGLDVGFVPRNVADDPGLCPLLVTIEEDVAWIWDEDAPDPIVDVLKIRPDSEGVGTRGPPASISSPDVEGGMPSAGAEFLAEGVQGLLKVTHPKKVRQEGACPDIPIVEFFEGVPVGRHLGRALL